MKTSLCFYCKSTLYIVRKACILIFLLDLFFQHIVFYHDSCLFSINAIFDDIGYEGNDIFCQMHKPLMFHRNVKLMLHNK